MLTGWRSSRLDRRGAARAIRRDPKVNPATAQNRRDKQLNREIARLSRNWRGKAIIDVKLCTARTSDGRGAGLQGLMAGSRNFAPGPDRRGMLGVSINGRDHRTRRSLGAALCIVLRASVTRDHRWS